MDKALRLYLLRSLLAPMVSLRWSRFIREFHRNVGAADPPARVLAKPLRNYVHRAFGPRRRFELLLKHYHWFDALFSRDFIRRICSGEALRVVALPGRKGSEYRLYVVASVVAILQREGELAIYLAKGVDEPKLCRLSLCFSEVTGRLSIVVGGIQGPLAAHKRDVIDATRDLHGLRPKDAVFLATRAMAQALGVQDVHAVSDANHALHRLQDKAKFSSYDAYWFERGGHPGGPYGFVFGPLDPIAASGDKRNAIKIAIVEAMGAFVRSHHGE
ncbi:MAG: DUF535 family protein [Roseiarcus sp.]